MTTTTPTQPYWEDAFLAALGHSGLIKRSAKAAGVTTGAVYGRRTRDPDFARRIEDAIALARGNADVLREAEVQPAKPVAQWRSAFLDALAESSNVTAAAARARVNPRVVYALRREDHEFATKWRAALFEGYANLEMEVLGYLRDPDPARRMDVGNALRLLAAHKDAVSAERAVRAHVSAAEVRASIARKVDAMRRQVLAEREARKGTGDESA